MSLGTAGTQGFPRIRSGGTPLGQVDRMRTRQVALTLPPDAASAGQARRFVTKTLRTWRVTALSDTAELLVSELVANAIRHTDTEVEVHLRLDGARLVVEVADCGPGHPRPRLPDLDGEEGRGLYLVDQLAGDWGVRPERRGKTVWFSLDADVRQSVPAR